MTATQSVLDQKIRISGEQRKSGEEILYRLLSLESLIDGSETLAPVHAVFDALNCWLSDRIDELNRGLKEEEAAVLSWLEWLCLEKICAGVEGLYQMAGSSEDSWFSFAQTLEPFSDQLKDWVEEVNRQNPGEKQGGAA